MQRYGARFVAIALTGFIVGSFIAGEGETYCTTPQYQGWGVTLRVLGTIAVALWVMYCAGREAGKERNY